MSANSPPILEARGVVKRFGGLVANDHVDLALLPGEVLALLRKHRVTGILAISRPNTELML